MAAPPGLKEQVYSFRLVELQEACTRLAISKTGRKDALRNRLLAYFGEAEPGADRRPVQPPVHQWRVETAARVIRDIYCRMKGLPNTPSDQSTGDQFLVRRASGAAGAAAPGLAGGPGHAAAHAPAVAHPPAPGGNYPAASIGGLGRMGSGGVLGRLGSGGAGRLNATIRCICSLQTERGQMIQCEDPACGVWQHCECLGLGGAGRPLPRHFFCETCRAKLADPFWEPVTVHVLPPSRLQPSGRPPLLSAQGMQPVQAAERTFFLDHEHMQHITQDPTNYRLQLGCLDVGDEVPFRYHWPRHVELRVNNMQFRPYTRAPNQKMGINQRDEPANIGSLCVRGRNMLSLSSPEPGIWVLLLQLARKRTVSQVKVHMAPPETLTEAAARVQRLVSGGDDEDEEDAIMVSQQAVSLKDPMSCERMKVPARFRDVSGLQCFDLDTFLSMVERNRKWQDPANLRNSTLPQLQIDTYMLRVLQCLARSPSVSDIELNADGRWRPAGAEGPWFSIHDDPAKVAAQAPVAVKPDPDSAAAGGGAAGGAADVPSSDEDVDEEAELRAAALAVAGQKRKERDEPEVIDLVDSDDEVAAPPPPRLQARPLQPPARPASRPQPPPAPTQALAAQQQPPQQPAGQARPASQPVGHHPLKIRLPIRPRGMGAAAQPRQPGLQPSAPAGAGLRRPVPGAQGAGLAGPPQQQQQHHHHHHHQPQQQHYHQQQQPHQQGLAPPSVQAGAAGAAQPSLAPPPPLVQYGSGGYSSGAMPHLEPPPQPALFYGQQPVVQAGYPHQQQYVVQVQQQPTLAVPLAPPAGFVPASHVLVQQQPPALAAGPLAPPAGFVPASHVLVQQQQQQAAVAALAPPAPLQRRPLAAPAESEEALDAFMNLLDQQQQQRALEFDVNDFLG